MLTVKQIKDKWLVMSDGEALASFDTNDAAWRHVDRLSNEPKSPSEKRADYAFNLGISK